MTVFLDKILAFTTRKSVYIGGWIAVLAFNVLIFPFFFHRFHPEGVSTQLPLDLRWSYNVEAVEHFFEYLGNAGRTGYAMSEILLDIPYMLIYSFLYMTTFYLLFHRNLNYKRWIMIPLFIGVFDFLENTGILMMLAVYPQVEKMPVGLFSAFTQAKWVVATVSLFTFAGAIIFYFIQKQKK